MPAAPEQRTLGDLVRELSGEGSTLFRQEVELAKAELAEKVQHAARATSRLALGGAIALAGGLVLLAAVVTGLTALLDTFMATELAAFLACLLVGGALAFAGYGMVRKALDAFRSEGLVPHKTQQTLQENTVWLKARMS